MCKIALIVIGIFIVLGVLGTIFGEPSDSSDQSTPQSAPNTPSSASSAEPTPKPTPSYIEVSATDLLAAYDENTVSKEGDVVTITGTCEGSTLNVLLKGCNLVTE